MRVFKRRDLETRNRIWKESCEKTQGKIAELERELGKLKLKMDVMAKARDEYNASNVVLIGHDEDVEVKERWEAFFRLESDEPGV
jgi:hypothetical protein